MPNIIVRVIGLAGVLALFGLVLGYFSERPSYVHFPPDKALVKISFTIGGRPVGKCRTRTDEELAKLPRQKRRRRICPRERSPVRVEVLLDGKPLYQAVIKPSGVAKDGPARVYQGFAVAPGKRRFVARLADTNRKTGFDYETKKEVVLKPRQHFIIDFRRDARGFVFR